MLIFRKAIASVMAVNGITLDMISMGDPETSTTSGRRLLQVGFGHAMLSSCICSQCGRRCMTAGRGVHASMQHPMIS